MINDSYQIPGESKYGMLFFDISNVQNNMLLQILSLSFIVNLGQQILPATAYAYESQGYEENLYGIKKVAVVYGYTTSNTQITEDMIKGLFGQINAQEITEEEFYNLGEGGSLIEFTINGAPYQAEEGMTWEQFVNSRYNDGLLSVSSKYVGHDGYWLAGTSSGMLAPSDIIVPGYNYEYALT